MPPGMGAAVGRFGAVSGAMNNVPTQFAGLDSFSDAAAAFNAADAQFDSIEGNGTPSPAAGPSGAKLLNPLRDYASFNYRLELGSLSVAELNTPVSSYRQSGLKNMIARSGGGNLGNRVTTYAEETFGPHAEYFIENLNIETVIAPNSNTGVASGTNITFTIIEPYSMGQWLESLQVSAEQSGFANYIEAPYCLKIDWVGQTDDTGDMNVPVAPKYIPIKIIKADFKVDGEGSQYQVEAIPFNEQALENTLTETPSDVSIEGSTIAELLQNGETSLSATVNDRNRERENTGQTSSTDRFIIMFPTDSQGATNAIESGRRNNNPATVDPQNLPTAGSAGPRVSSERSVYDTLVAYARNNVNEIGQSRVVLDPNEDRNHASANSAGAASADGTVSRAAPALQIQDNVAVAQYPRNTDITQIIHDMLTYSEYGTRFATGEPSEGQRQWYRIEVQTFLERDPTAELQTGAMPKVFVYSVVPYRVDETSAGAPSKSPAGIDTLRRLALKEYNYLYTGINEEILNFDINFEFAFYQNSSDTSGQLGFNQVAGGDTANPRSPAPTTGRPDVNTNRSLASESSLREGITPERNRGARRQTAGGFHTSLSRGRKAAIAELFHDNIINSSADLINVKMDVRGDPYYLPTSGMGNYNAEPTNRPALTRDGTMNYQNGEVHVIVNFRLPFDYNDQTGRMDFSDKQAMFSGIYRVIGVINKFDNGEFTQELDLVRIPGQQSPASSQQNQIVERGNAFTDMNTHLSQVPGGSGSGIGAQGSPNDSGVQETLPVPAGGQNPTGQGLNSNRPGVSPPTTGDGSLGTITTSIRGLSTQVAASLVPNFQGLIDELENDLGYEIKSLGGYNYRTIANSSTLSWHSGGIAIDINPPQNPYITRRNAQVVTDMPNAPNGSLMTALAAKYGFGWGGDWTSSKDAMHFSAARNEGGTLDVARGEIP